MFPQALWEERVENQSAEKRGDYTFSCFHQNGNFLTLLIFEGLAAVLLPTAFKTSARGKKSAKANTIRSMDISHSSLTSTARLSNS
ncbi:MAG: hypothetical protein H6Q40_134 [Deltaproteobacteria bacterium]|nr:hypothetical protein [Deltaproteobacteria bacterium]